MFLKCKGSFGKKPMGFSKACRLPGLLGMQGISLGWAGKKGWTQGSHPTLTLLPMGSCVHWHIALICPSPSLSFFNAFYKYCHFLVTCHDICAGFTLLFTFKLPLLYNSLDIFTFTSKSNPLGAEQHTGKLWPEGAARCCSILNSMFVSHLQDNIRHWLRWIKEKNPVLLH